MTYKGHVENGVIVLDEAVSLEEGQEVSVDIPNEINDRDETSTAGPSLAERLASVIGKAEGLPEDWSENHDFYLREEHRG